MFTPSLALPILSCLRPSAAVVVFDNGGLKTTRTGTEMNDALSAPRTVQYSNWSLGASWTKTKKK